MQDRFVAIGVDPDTFATGLALVSCALPPGADAPHGITVEQVAVAAAEGPDARARLVHMASALQDQIESMVGSAGHDVDIIVVEGQAARPGDKRPDDIVQLAVVQGIAMGALRAELDATMVAPLPVQWKGTRTKKAHQADLLKCLGLCAELKGIPGSERGEGQTAKQAAKQRGHVVDAIGLAVWGLEQLATRERMARFLS